MSETEAAFAERTIRSLKKILYRYMEDNRYKYIHNLLNSLQHKNLEEIARQIRYQRMQKIPIFGPFSTANHYEKIENPSLK